MRVVLFPSDAGACGFYRMQMPQRVLAAAGYDVRVGKLFFGQPQLDGDVVVFQRPLDRPVVETIIKAKQQGITTVVELDDDFLNAPTDNPASALRDPRLSPQRNTQLLGQALYVADLVTVTTPSLRRVYSQFVGHNRFVVLPNCVPQAYLEIEAQKVERLQLGWTGSVTVHGSDLQACGPAVRQVLDEHPEVQFRVVGSAFGVHKALGLQDDFPIQATRNWKKDENGEDQQTPHGWLPLHLYPLAMATIDVGIVPLRRETFTQGKSWLKGLEFASLGVPFVATATDPYRALRTEGAGLLADRPKDWLKHLRRLIDSSTYRQEQASWGRAAAKRWTYEQQADRWLEAWAVALHGAGVPA